MFDNRLPFVSNLNVIRADESLDNIIISSTIDRFSIDRHRLIFSKQGKLRIIRNTTFLTSTLINYARLGKPNVIASVAIFSSWK